MLYTLDIDPCRTFVLRFASSYIVTITDRVVRRTPRTNERRTGPSRFSFSLYDHMPAECTSSAKLCLYVTRFVNSVYCRFCAPLSIHVWCSGALPMHTDEKYLKNGTFILAKKNLWGKIFILRTHNNYEFQQTEATCLVLQ